MSLGCSGGLLHPFPQEFLQDGSQGAGTASRTELLHLQNSHSKKSSSTPVLNGVKNENLHNYINCTTMAPEATKADPQGRLASAVDWGLQGDPSVGACPE